MKATFHALARSVAISLLLIGSSVALILTSSNSSVSAWAAEGTSPCTIEQLRAGGGFQYYMGSWGYDDDTPYIFGLMTSSNSYYNNKPGFFVGPDLTISDDGSYTGIHAHWNMLISPTTCNLQDVAGDPTQFLDDVYPGVLDSINTHYFDGLTPPFPDILSWGYTCRVVGLKVSCMGQAGKSIDPMGGDIVKFEWEFNGGSNWVDFEKPIYESYILKNSQFGPFYQEITYTYETAGTYDIGMIATDENGKTAYTHRDIEVGGTGEFTTDLNNGEFTPDSEFACGATDLSCIFGETMKMLFTPTTNISAYMNSTFNVGVLNPTLGVFLDFFNSMFVTTPSCALELSDVQMTSTQTFPMSDFIPTACNTTHTMLEDFPIVAILTNFSMAFVGFVMIAGLVNKLLNPNDHDIIPNFDGYDGQGEGFGSNRTYVKGKK